MNKSIIEKIAKNSMAAILLDKKYDQEMVSKLADKISGDIVCKLFCQCDKYYYSVYTLVFDAREHEYITESRALNYYGEDFMACVEFRNAEYYCISYIFFSNTKNYATKSANKFNECSDSLGRYIFETLNKYLEGAGEFKAEVAQKFQSYILNDIYQYFTKEMKTFCFGIAITLTRRDCQYGQ